MLHAAIPAPTGGVEALLAKLETVAALPQEDREALRAMCTDSRELDARRTIIREGDRPDCVHLVLDGWAARYSLLADGGRQITAFLIPGDFCDLHVTILGEMDHSIATITRATIAYAPRAVMDALTARPAVAMAMWWATLVDEAVLRAWIVNVGRRDAAQAIGHLMCELYLRLRNVGLATDHSYDLPLTQEELADALGLTPVHVNRVLKRMRADGLASLKRGALTIHDYRLLERASGFNPSYLHIGKRRAPERPQ
jgi:CRP-like cAMP-binding protein